MTSTQGICSRVRRLHRLALGMPPWIPGSSPEHPAQLCSRLSLHELHQSLLLLLEYWNGWPNWLTAPRGTPTRHRGAARLGPFRPLSLWRPCLRPGKLDAAASP